MTGKHEFDPRTERCIWCKQGRVASSLECTAVHTYREFLINGNVWIKIPAHAPYINAAMLAGYYP